MCSQRITARQVARAAVLLCLVAIAPVSRASSHDPQRVLILTDFHQRSGPFMTVANAFSNELLERETRPILMRYVDLNVRDQQDISTEAVHRLLLERVFAAGPPDLILALGPPAVAFWQRNRGEAFQQVPVLASAGDLRNIDPQFIAGQWAVVSRFSFDEQVAGIRQLLPETRHVLLVLGASLHERALAREAQEQIQAAIPDMDLEPANDLSLAEIIDRSSRLRAGSVVYYAFLGSDVTGEQFREEDALARIRAASRVPVFGPFDAQLGHGIVGGRMIQLERAGETLAELAHGILTGDPGPRGAHHVDLSTPVYDWRELNAWGIPLERLPPGGEVRFRPPGPWDLYRGWIIAVALLLAAQAWIIGQWAIQRQRSRRHEAANAELRKRLITAYEDERRLIARELHDDLSQRLASLSIDASLALTDAGDVRREGRLTQMQQDLARISEDVHDLSYRLHPTLLEDLGLANALSAECQRMQRHTDASVRTDIQDGLAKLPLPVQLNLYRIGQEALQNAIRHSGASSIDVRLHFHDRELSLEVSDNGRGFSVGSFPSTSSLGIASMRERAGLAGAALRIDSQPGKGTKVSVSVPAARPA